MITALIICVNSCVFNRLHTPFPKYKHFFAYVRQTPICLLEVFLFLVVEGDEDGEHRGEGPEGGASVAHEW